MPSTLRCACMALLFFNLFLSSSCFSFLPSLVASRTVPLTPSLCSQTPQHGSGFPRLPIVRQPVLATSLSTENKDSYELKAETANSFVLQKISEIEDELGLKVFFAVEHSSHVWGTAHDESDWDVKIVFCYGLFRYFSPGAMQSSIERKYHAQKPSQTAIEKKRSPSSASPSSLPNDVEIVGYDVLKFMQLVMSGNGMALEMFESPLLYVGTQETVAQLATACKELCNPSKLAWHHIGFAKKTFYRIKEGKDSQGRKELKYVSYVFRNLLRAFLLMSSSHVAGIPQHWSGLCDKVDSLNAQCESDDQMIPIDVDRCRALFSRFGTEAVDQPMGEEEKEELLSMAELALESAENRVKDLSAKAKGPPPSLKRSWDERLGKWALELVTTLHPQSSGGVGESA